jgi:hypothetical protein
VCVDVRSVVAPTPPVRSPHHRIRVADENMTTHGEKFKILFPIPHKLAAYPRNLFNPYNIIQQHVIPVLYAAKSDVYKRNILNFGQLIMQVNDTETSTASTALYG